MLFNPLTDAMSDGLADHFRSPRTRIDVAMAAGLVALAADVQLQRLQPTPSQRQAMLRQLLFEPIHESVGRIMNSGFYAIPILRGQKGAPITLRIHVTQLAQYPDTQSAPPDARDRFRKNFLRAPRNVLKQLRQRPV